MRSQTAYSMTMVLSLMVIFVHTTGVALPENSPQGEHGGTMQDMSEGASHEMPMTEDGAPTTQATIRLSPAQRQLIGVTSATVEQTTLKKTIRAVARVDFDERRLADVTFKIGGWIQDLFVDYTGRRVRKGEPLLTLYSPDLVTSQEEYLLALRTRDQLAQSSLPEARNGSQGLVEAARRRLLLWDLTPQQVKALEERGAAQTYLTLTAPASGIVVEKMAVKGMRVEPGMKLYRIADLSTVWLYADIYEYEVPLVREGQEVTISLSYYPGETFRGAITYIYPYLDAQTRTNKVRLEFANPQGKLKPGMYANSEIAINLGTTLTVPESAVLQSGLRQLVFVEQGQGVFAPREVKLGVKADSRFAVLNGLSAGERVVTSGNFLLDSESKLQSATSMMGMMGAIGMGDWKMESARPMEMGAQTAQAQPAEKKVGSLTVTVSTAPDTAKLGENTLRIQVKDGTGKPVTDAAVSLEYTMDMPGMLIDKAAAKHTGDGVYEAPVRFAMAGPWGVTVSIQRPGQAEARARFSIGVSQ
ncbi:MAG: efflux RND transporter periplasmic adaptor subunit [Deltaproteobacteria bacterium]|nr:efflux RND transporter periplasmic adaptor subunit [Deltaproteobacteria bacterium]